MVVECTNTIPTVKSGFYAMHFKTATDILTYTVNSADIAEECGVARASIHQARMAEGSGGHRPPPAGWEKPIAKLARSRAAELLELANMLDADTT